MSREWPEFVVEDATKNAAREGRRGELTGWETVVFEVEPDAPYDSPSDFATAALAP